MATLETGVKLADPDRAYRMLIEAHRGLTDHQSAALNARLILILANQIGDLEVLRQAIALARTSDAFSKR
jgi:Protein of unknown function (DUF2783)